MGFGEHAKANHDEYSNISHNFQKVKRLRISQNLKKKV